MKRILYILCLAIAGNFVAHAQNKIVIPDTKEYLVLTGDMHMHTIFSDGSVWPITRVDEAYSEGVEVICITDHMDERHQKFAKSGKFVGDRNYSYEVAAKRGKELGVTVIKGAEITRRMPPGHFNTLFISDVEPIAKVNDAETDHQKGMLAGLEQAQKQNAFCVWNHPHWAAQQPAEIKWFPEHEEIYQKGYMHGIEAYNSCDGFSFDAFQWALDKNLTLICGTDSHAPIFMEYNFPASELRPVTLIFAKENTVESIHEALKARRTAIFADGCVYGSEELLTSLLDACFCLESVKQKDYKTLVRFVNKSSIPLRLRKNIADVKVSYTNFNVVYPFETQEYVCADMKYKEPIAADEFTLSFKVENFYTAPGKNLNYKIKIKK